MSRSASDVSADELRGLYDAVILAIGAPHDRKLGIPGEDLPGVVGSAEFVGWYNGHPDFADLAPPLDGTHAAVIGNGNVALDCARILSKNQHEFEGSDIVGHALEALDRSAIQTVTILGRRGPHQISMTPKELGELGHLEAATPVVDSRRLPAGRGGRGAGARPPQVDHHPARVRRGRTRRVEAQADRLRLLRQAAPDRGRRQGRAADRRADGAGRIRRRQGHRRDL